jgi:hypothetical protein
MARKLLAVLLMLSWIVLSGFDLLEDLQFETGASAYSHSRGAGDKSLPPHSKRHASLTNNIVESAAGTQVFYPSLLRLTPSQSAVPPILSSHRVSELHKLNRVFLI